MGLVAINQYHMTLEGQTMYAYGTSPPSTNSSSWTKDGVAFYGCQESDDGAIPIYQFYAGIGKNDDEYTKYAYSTSVSIGGGWIPSSPTTAHFYANATNAQGGQPVYNLQALDKTWGTFYYLGNYPTSYLPVYSTAAYDESGILFYAVPGNAQLTYVQTSASYDTKQMKPSTPKAVFQQTLDNSSGGSTLSTSFTFQYSTTASFSWSLNEGLTIGGQVAIKVGIPFLGSTFTINGSFTFSANETWSSSQEETLSLEVSVTAPAGQDVLCVGYVTLLTDATCPFTLTLMGTATSADGNQTVTLAQPAAVALYQLQNPGATAPVLLPGDSIQVLLSGTFTGSYADGIYASLSDVTSDATSQPMGTGAAPTLTPETKNVSFVPG